MVCPENCAECNSAGECTSCDSGYRVFENKCQKICTSKEVQIGLTCEACHSTCLTCDSVKANGCLSCDKTKYTLTTDKTCYDCVNDYRDNKELCPKTHEYIIKRVTSSKRTEGLIVDISFDKSDKILTTLKKVKDWSKLFKTTIDGLEEGTDYKAELKMEKNSLLYLCDF